MPGARAALLVGLVLATSCAAPPPASVRSPERVVSLAPSATEIVYALGAGARLVGVCAQCNYPEAVARVPRVGGYLVPSVEAVVAARPDLVVAVPSPGNRDAVLALERLGTRVVVVKDRTLADLWTAIRSHATALGDPEAGERLVTDLHRRLEEVHARVKDLPPRRVLAVIGHKPLVAVGGGTLQDEILTLAGGVNVAADAGTFWPTITLELVVARAPEVIVNAVMGTEDAARDVFGALTVVPAVGGGRVVTLKDDTFFRAGPRVPEAARELAAAIHPEAFPESARAG
jgi:iron complex transport system substrate-binding protein